MPRASRALTIGMLGCLVLAGCGPASGALKAAHPPGPTTAQPDWPNALYSTSCDGLLLGRIRARLIDGTAHIPVDVSESSSYDEVDLQLQATATGQLTGDATPDTVVLLQCSPQPSNGSVQEVHVFRSDGSQRAVLPSPRSLPQATILAPLYDPAGLRIENGDIVTVMKGYGPNDSHATGPSQPFAVRWHWTGSGFAPLP